MHFRSLCVLFYPVFRCCEAEMVCSNDVVLSQPETLSFLPQQLESAPRKRLLIKVNGFLASSNPIHSKEGQETDAVLIRRKSTSWATNRHSSVLDTLTSVAEDVQVRIKSKDNTNTYVEGPVLHLSPSLLEDAPTTIANSTQTFVGNRWFTAIMSLGILNFTWRMIDTVEVIPQGKPVFAALDAVSDSNGRITLIETSTVSDRKILTYKHYAQIMDEKNDQATVWKGFAISSAFVGCVLAGVAAMSR